MKTTQYELHAEIEEKHWWFLARRQIMTELVRRVAPAGATIVDIGCGTGANLAALAHDYACVGIDPSPVAIQLAKERFPGIRFVCGSASESLSQPGDQAHVYLLMDILEHVPDDFLLLSQVLSAVPPGAHVLITVPAGQTLWSAHDVSFGHYRRYDRARFERLWAGLPIEPRLVSYYNARLYPLVKVMRTISRYRGRPAGMAGTDFRVPGATLNGALERAFKGEARRLIGVLEGRYRSGFKRGVSLIAVLRRTEGTITPFARPADVAADPKFALGGAS